MAKGVTTKCYLFFPVLLNFLGATLTTDAYSFSCNLIIKTAEHLWCVAQCSVDGISFLQFDNINKTTSPGNLGNMANATEVRRCLTEHLEDLGQELRSKMESLKTSGYPTLQATMLSEHSQGQILSACWQFNISEKYFFTFDTMTMSWRLTNVPENIMNEWKVAKLKRHLNFSIVECSQKLSGYLKQYKEKPMSSSRSPDVTQLTSPTWLPPNRQFPYKEVLIPVGLILILIICIYVKRKYCTQGDRNLQLLKTCCIDCHKPQRNNGPKETRGEVPNQTTKMLSQEEEPKACG